MIVLLCYFFVLENGAVAQQVVVKVDWNTVLRTVDAKAYGVDCPACFDPRWTHSPNLMKPLAEISAGAKPLIRLHGWGMVTQGSNECWLNADNTWNGAKIKEALAPLVAAGYRIMIDIPAGPGGENDVKDPVALTAFAAALVRVVNVEHHFGVKYWEIPNERERLMTASEMASFLLIASRAMKAVDPTILFGGPATDSINVDYLATVVQRSGDALDFITVHTYGGDGKQADAVSYGNALKAVADVHLLRERLDEVSKGKRLPIFVDEYNIGWDPTPKIVTNEGAVYFSIIQAGVVHAGGDASAVWDFSPPHNMSVVDREGRLSASGHLFTLMNQHFHGKEVSAASSDQAKVQVFAVKGALSHATLLSNLSDVPQVIHVSFEGWESKRVQSYQISSSGYSGPSPLVGRSIEEKGLTLPPKSVTVLLSQ